jgi:hypothetical protein
MSSERVGTAVVIASALTYDDHLQEKAEDGAAGEPSTPRTGEHENIEKAQRAAGLKTVVKQLGGLPVICHVLWQINLAEIAKVVIVLGPTGRAVRKEVDTMVKDEGETFEGLEIVYIDLGEDWSGGHSQSILAAAATAGPRLADVGHVVLVGTTHIVHETLLREMARTPLGDDDACLLVEKDLSTLSGVPANTLHVAFRHDSPSGGLSTSASDCPISEVVVGHNLAGGYGGVGAGVVSCGQAVFEELARVPASPASPAGGTLAGALNKFAKNGSLRMMQTGGKLWFSVEESGLRTVTWGCFLFQKQQ